MKINIHNYEPYFLSYIDNELSVAEKKEVELFLLEYPNYAAEMALLKQAILLPEEIIYEDKALLYRHEEMEAKLSPAFKQSLYKQEAPVIKGYFNSTRMRAITAVAALFLLMIGYQWFARVEDPTTSPYASNNASPMAANNEVPTTGSKKSEGSFLVSEQPSKTIVKTNTSERTNTSTITNTSVHNQLATQAILPITPKETAETLSQNSYATIETYNKLATAEDLNTHSKTIPVAPVVNANMATTTETTTAESSRTEAAMSYEEYNTDNADRGIYIANLEIDGEKLRGLGRRFNALIRKNKNR